MEAPNPTTRGKREVAESNRFRSILEILAERARGGGPADAFRVLPEEGNADPAEGAAWSWGELAARARGVAGELARGEVGPGARVLLAYGGGLDFVAALYGCLHLGAVPVPVSPPRRREALSRWAHVSRDAGAAAILAAPVLVERFRPMFEGVGPCLAPEAADPARPFAPRADDPVAWRPGPDDLALLQYTSGSTGAPRGVAISHRALMANLEQIRGVFGAGSADRMISWLPPYHDMGLISATLAPVHAGFPVALVAPAAFLRDPMRFLELAGRLGATGLGGPNFAWEHCLRHATPEALARIDLSVLRIAFCGAEPIRADTLRRFHAAFAPRGFAWSSWLCCYGMAEATLLVSGDRRGEGPTLFGVAPDALAAHRVTPGAGAEIVASGRPAAGIDLAIVDPATGARLASDRVGEVWMRGPNLARGYWGQPEATARDFDQTLDGTGGWMRSGDLGFLREGRLFVAGRIKDLIVIRGRNHYPQDIEATLARAHPDLAPGRAAAVAFEEAGEERLGVACELSRAGARAPDAPAIFAAIRAALGEAHGLQPGRIALLRPGALPMTPSGKPQCFACRAGLAQDSLPALALWRAAHTPRGAALLAPAAPRGALAAALRAAPLPLRRPRLIAHLRQARAAHAPQPGGALPDPGARFFEMGLDSVAGVALVAEIEGALDLPLEATLLDENPTIAALADHLLGRLSARAPEGAAR